MQEMPNRCGGPDRSRTWCAATITRWLASAALMLLVSTPAFAEPVPDGDELLVDPGEIVGGQDTDVAALADGGFVVVWTGADASRVGVFGQVFDQARQPTVHRCLGDLTMPCATNADCGGECAIAPFQVNTYTTDYQRKPGVVPMTDGGFFIVWDSAPYNTAFVPGCCPQDGDDGGIIGRRFDASALPVGTEFVVNTYTTGHQSDVRIDEHDGGFVVAWTTPGAQAGASYVVARRFDASADPLGAELLVNPPTSDALSAPNVSAAADGSFVAAWSSNDTGHIFARRVSSAGVPLDTPFQVSTGDGIDVRNGYDAVAVDDAGNFAVAWVDMSLSGGSQLEIRARRFDSTGTEIGTEFQVNAYTPGVRFLETAEMLNDGSFVITWRAPSSGAEQDVGPYLRRFLASGDSDGGDVPMSSGGALFASNARLAPTADGGFLAAYTGTASQGGTTNRPLVRKFGVASGVCGDANGDGAIAATDALAALLTAVGAGSCLACVCNVNGDASVTATDALIILKSAVGQPVELACAAC